MSCDTVSNKLSGFVGRALPVVMGFYRAPSCRAHPGAEFIIPQQLLDRRNDGVHIVGIDNHPGLIVTDGRTHAARIASNDGESCRRCFDERDPEDQPRRGSGRSVSESESGSAAAVFGTRDLRGSLRLSSTASSEAGEGRSS